MNSAHMLGGFGFTSDAQYSSLVAHPVPPPVAVGYIQPAYIQTPLVSATDSGGLPLTLNLPLGSSEPAKIEIPVDVQRCWKRNDPKSHLSKDDDPENDDEEPVVRCKSEVIRRNSGVDLMLPPGLEAPSNGPSKGSILHGTGDCKPCAWFWKPTGCQNGSECKHCHLCPEGTIKSRKKNKVAMLRLGLATPKAQDLRAAAASFGMESMESIPMVGVSFGMEPMESTSMAVVGFGMESMESAYISTSPLRPETENESTTCSLSDQELKGIGNADSDTASVSDAEKPMQSPKSKGLDRSGNEVQFPPGLAPPVEMPSHGSMLHETGDCRPCAFFWKPGSCQNGQHCTYCHLCPDGQIKALKKNKQALQRLGFATP